MRPCTPQLSQGAHIAKLEQAHKTTVADYERVGRALLAIVSDIPNGDLSVTRLLDVCNELLAVRDEVSRVREVGTWTPDTTTPGLPLPAWSQPPVGSFTCASPSSRLPCCLQTGEGSSSTRTPVDPASGSHRNHSAVVSDLAGKWKDSDSVTTTAPVGQPSGLGVALVGFKNVAVSSARGGPSADGKDRKDRKVSNQRIFA